MNKTLGSLLKILIPIGVGIYLVVHIYAQLDQDQRNTLFTALRKANYWFVGLSFLIGLLSHYIRAYRWNFQLEAMGRQISNFNGFLAVMIGYIVNLVLPRVGEASRAAAITKYEGVPFDKSFGSILSERALDFVLLLLISLLTLVLQYSVLQPVADQLLSSISGRASSFILWTMLIVAVLVGTLAIKALDRFKHIPVVHKAWELKEGILEGLRSIFKMKRRVSYLIATLAIWACYIAMFWVCFFAIPETGHLGPDAVSASFVVGSLAIIIIPGGIGAFPVGIMQALMLYGIAGETGFALGWIIWFSQTSMIVIFGGLSMLLIPIVNRSSNARVKT